ncbi:MAG TPA: ASKHA domain-containing protein [Candidatus Deferrimicrobiaceae bacterium]|nr:ASKHA domain-containing protein [Candidatus Deferrimicrobiaceae bacterium]
MGDSAGGRLRFLPECVSAPLSPGETILAHALRAGVPLLAPCGGEGRCGKCRVAVAGESQGGDDPGILSREDQRAGIRLACRCTPLSGDLDVTVLPESRPARLSAYIEGREMDEEGSRCALHLVPDKGIPLGVALDVGTSTLAGALIDLRDGTILARTAGDNPQMACGEDLISRIVFEEETPGGLAFLRRLLLGGLDRLIASLLSSSPEPGKIVEIAAAGNTVLSHILYGVSPAPLRRPPHRPAMKEYPVKTGRDLGVSNAPSARVRIFPSLGGFVGGDIVAGMLASGMHRSEAVSLLFDVGTNGEVALGNREFRIACSSSAGPAFEGGEVACGMRAYPGAIESVRIDPSTLAAEWTVIGGRKPAGVCGSGILDLVAELFKAGLIDRTGRFVPRTGAPFVDTARGIAYLLVEAGRSAAGTDIAFTASDLKSVIRTKAALCAAADALLRAVGLSREEVEQVYIAGGFGNFLDLRSAMTIGLFPPFPLKKFVPLGNASLAGAIGVLRNRKRWEEASALAPSTAYHDLSSDPGFMELYQRALFLPHTDAESYRLPLSPEIAR